MVVLVDGLWCLSISVSIRCVEVVLMVLVRSCLENWSRLVLVRVVGLIDIFCLWLK